MKNEPAFMAYKVVRRTEDPNVFRSVSFSHWARKYALGQKTESVKDHPLCCFVSEANAFRFIRNEDLMTRDVIVLYGEMEHSDIVPSRKELCRWRILSIEHPVPEWPRGTVFASTFTPKEVIDVRDE